MDKAGWLRRNRAEQAMARGAVSAESRLIHYDLAGRCSVAALASPFLLPRRGPANDGEREALRVPLPSLRKILGPPNRGKPGAGKGDGR